MCDEIITEVQLSWDDNIIEHVESLNQLLKCHRLKLVFKDSDNYGYEVVALENYTESQVNRS